MASDILHLDEFQQRFNDLFQEAPFSAALLTGDEFIVEMANAVTLDLWGKDRSIIGKPLLTGMPEMKDQEVFRLLTEVYRSGETYEGKEHVAWLHNQGVLKRVYVNFVFKAIKGSDSQVAGVFAVGYDVTDQVMARQRMEQSETRMRLAIESTGLGTYELNFKTGEVTSSSRFNELFGFDGPVNRDAYASRIHPLDRHVREEAHARALTTGRLRYDARLALPDGTVRWIAVNGAVVFDANREPMLLLGTVVDITEDKLVFHKIQESEEKFRTLITETPEVGVGLYVGADFVIKYVNGVMLQFWDKDESAIGKPLKDALPGMEDQPFLAQLSGVYTSGVPFTGREEKAWLMRNGKLELGYYDYTFKALRDLSGQIYAVHHMAIDVTERVKSKLNLIESEREVRTLFEQTPVGIAVMKGEALIIEMANDAMVRYWGRNRSEVLGRPIFEALPEVVEQGIEKIVRKVYETGESFASADMPVSFLRHGRMETIFVRFALQPMRDWQGKITGLLAIANDVTDLVTARHTVEKNEMRLKFLADSMPQVVWIADGDGTVTYYNKRVHQFAGAKQNDDGTWSWEGTVHPDDWEVTIATWTLAVRTKTPYEIEHRVLMHDGTYRWHLSRAYAYETDEGTKWYGTATDVHDQKSLEANLESLVKKRTEELQRSNDDLQQFAHVASHDLKEPVRKVKTFSYRLRDEYSDVLGTKGAHFIDKIINASDRMDAMINGVLRYASVPASDAYELLDLNEVMDTVQNDLELLIQDKGATITYAQLPPITGIKDLIYQLFYNLINNALKFSRRGVTPVIEVRGGAVDVQGRPFWEIRVKDNGIGFDQQYAEGIFSLFVRLNSKDRYEGSGLGLALCKKIVERHGGTIRAQGEKGSGAEFQILFPK